MGQHIRNYPIVKKRRTTIEKLDLVIRFTALMQRGNSGRAAGNTLGVSQVTIKRWAADVVDAYNAWTPRKRKD